MVDGTLDFEQYYWIALVIGLGYWLLTTILGDFLDSINFPIDPIDIASFITMFGGFGIGTNSLFQFSFWTELALVLLLAVVTTILIHFFLIVPLKRTESSLSYNDEDMQGRRAIVTLEIPSQGYGNVSIDLGIKRMKYTANSLNNTNITEGTEVLIIDMDGSIATVEELEKI